jgi:hypothetical protein
MRIPILAYHSMNLNGADYAHNDLLALKADLRQLTDAGFVVRPLHALVSDFLRGDKEIWRKNIVGLSCDDGADFDFHDLPHPVVGTQRSVLNTLKDFDRETRSRQPELNITSFVIVSPEARRALDRTCMIGKGWWNDDWWASAVATGLMHIGNHSWDHHHDTLPDSFSMGARRGTFTTIDNKELADHEVRTAAEYLWQRVPNAGARLFAYPYGEPSPYLVREYLPRYAGELRLEAAFTDRAGFLTEATNRWEIPRFVCGRDWKSPSGLAKILEESLRAPSPHPESLNTAFRPEP